MAISPHTAVNSYDRASISPPSLRDSAAAGAMLRVIFGFSTQINATPAERGKRFRPRYLVKKYAESIATLRPANKIKTSVADAWRSLSGLNCNGRRQHASSQGWRPHFTHGTSSLSTYASSRSRYLNADYADNIHKHAYGLIFIAWRTSLPHTMKHRVRYARSLAAEDGVDKTGRALNFIRPIHDGRS